jgi:NADH:ubiquinone oxidoreductase subunit K
MNFSLFLFLIGILGFILNRKNIILMIIAIEIMLLAVTAQLFYVQNFNNNFSQILISCILPFQITGITDGDGNFGFSIIKNKNKNKWLVIPSFSIVADVNPDNYGILIKINLFF